MTCLSARCSWTDRGRVSPPRANVDKGSYGELKPSMNCKVRVVADWTLAMFLRREVVSLGGLHEPLDPFMNVNDMEGLAEARSVLERWPQA